VYGFVIVVTIYHWWDNVYATICTLLKIWQLIFSSVIFKAVNLLIGVTWIEEWTIMLVHIFHRVLMVCVSVTTSEHVYLWSPNHDYKIHTSPWTNIIVHCSIQVTPISKFTVLKISLENISCQILRRVHIVTYKISHQFYMVTTIAKPTISPCSLLNIKNLLKQRFP
jgi:hypothetical protein